MKNILIIFGGKSTEHEVSIVSAKNVIDNLDRELFNPILVGISKEGNWFLLPDKDFVKGNGVGVASLNLEKAEEVHLNLATCNFYTKNENMGIDKIDAIFPILHGKNGEDGSVQGLVRLLNIPVVGCDILSSAVCMDKDVAKRLLNEAGINNARFVTLRIGDEFDLDEIVSKLGLPLFVKSVNSGSSVGVYKVDNIEDLPGAIENAFKYDDKVILEYAVEGREIEISVMGNDNVVTSDVIGEIVSNKDDFYSYDAKYIDKKAVKLVSPAEIDPEKLVEIQQIAIKTYKTLECRGLARVDIFLQDNGDIFVNEVNTIPGFTSISMFPKLFTLSNISYKNLITKIINLAIN